MFDKNFFGANLKKIRKFYNLTIVNLCSPLGINKGTISNLENGVKSPSLDMLIELADYFNVSLDYLVGRNDDPQYDYYFQKAENALLQDMPEGFITIFKYAKNRGLKQETISLQEHFQLIKWFEDWKQEIIIQQEYWNAKNAYREEINKKHYEKQLKSESMFQPKTPRAIGIVDVIKEKILIKEPVFNYYDKKTPEDWERDKILEEKFHYQLRNAVHNFPYIEFPSISMPNQLSEYLLPIVDADIKQGIEDYVKKISD